MKIISKIIAITLLAAVLLLAFPGQSIAQGPTGDQVIFGGQFTLRDGEILNGSLTLLGGSANLEEGSRVNGSVVVMGGSVEVRGEVMGDVNVIGGSVYLGGTAHVRGDIITVGGSVARQPGARVDGASRQADPEDFSLPPQITRPGRFLPDLGINLRPIGSFLWFIFYTLTLSALAVLVAMFLGRPTQRTAQTIVSQPVISGAMGFLTLLIAPALMLVLAVTIILIPLSLIGFLALGVAFVFGWIALGYEVGHRMAAMLKTTWTVPVSAGLGTLVLTIVASAVAQIPCIGWVVVPVVAVIGLGGVILSRFGTRVYLGQTPPPPPPAVVRPVTPVTPVAPVSPSDPVPPVVPVEPVQSPVDDTLVESEPMPFGDPFERPTPPEEDPTELPVEEPEEDPDTLGKPPEEPLP